MGWSSEPVHNDAAFDLLLKDESGSIRVQVKLQRRQKGIPLLHRKFPGSYVVETQRTRGGTRRETNEPSRPYRVEEFDVLAVCLQPSTGDWRDFVYCAARDLLTRKDNEQLLEVLQPVPMKDSKYWGRSFEDIVRRLRSKPGERSL